jgi:hypothetical protein
LTKFLESSEMNRALTRGAVWSTWTLGSLFGAWNLFIVHTRLLGNPPSHNQSHAGFQIWGFVFLLAMAARSDIPVRFTLWGTIAAQALITWGRVDILPGALATLVFGSFLQLFVTLVARAPLPWIASGALLAAGAVEALIERDIDASLRWAHAMYAVALFGAAFPDIHPFRAGRWLSRLGAVVLAAGALARSTPAVDVGWILVGLAVYPRPFGLLFSVLAIGYGVADLALGVSSMILDGARHAFTLGVLTAALFDKAGSRWGLRLIAAGTLLRQAQVAAALFDAPAWLYVSAPSGFVAAAGIILCGRALLRRTPSAAPRA